MPTRLLITAALLVFTIGFALSRTVDPVGWQTLRSSAIMSFPLPG